MDDPLFRTINVMMRPNTKQAPPNKAGKTHIGFFFFFDFFFPEFFLGTDGFFFPVATDDDFGLGTGETGISSRAVSILLSAVSGTDSFGTDSFGCVSFGSGSFSGWGATCATGKTSTGSFEAVGTGTGVGFDRVAGTESAGLATFGFAAAGTFGIEAGFSVADFSTADFSTIALLRMVVGVGCFSDSTKATSIALIKSEAVAKRETGFFANRWAKHRCRGSGNSAGVNGVAAFVVWVRAQDCAVSLSSLPKGELHVRDWYHTHPNAYKSVWKE